MFLGDPKIQTEYEYDAGLIIVIHNQTSKPYLNNDRILAGYTMNIIKLKT